ncbi:MAG: RNase adapter RapZ [Clostridia bacterium]|nr:RNase adapter RapZ [Clostridia bacterium]
MDIVIVTGLSGAGKTQAVICLEDLGYYCIDNMPPALINNFIDLVSGQRSEIKKVAFVVDIRGGEFFADTIECLNNLKKKGIEYKIVFLEASLEVLIRRYNETRRLHPLATDAPSNIDGIRKEMKTLEEFRKQADYIIDTSNMKAVQLRQEINNIFTTNKRPESFTVNIKSFGYKHGIPLDADIVFDMRFVANPYYVPSLKNLTGNSQKVRKYVMKHEEAKKFLDSIYDLISFMIPSYIKEGKYHLNIAFGCTGGQHRSVTMANEFADRCRAEGRRITLEHRDIK